MTKKQWIIMTRYPVALVTTFAQVFLIVLLFTLATIMFAPGGMRVANQGGATVGGLVMYGFVLFTFLSDTLWTIGYSIRWEQYEGTLESLYLTPASKIASLISRTIVTLIWTGANVLASIIFVQLIIGRLPFQNVGLAAYLLVLTLMGTFGMGFAFAAYTLLVKESAQSTANLLQFFFLGFCAMFFPFSALPPVMLVVSRLIPLSYAVDAFRSTLMGFPRGYPELLPIDQEVVIVTLFGLLMPIVGLWLYRQVENKVRRDGTLAEY